MSYGKRVLFETLREESFSFTAATYKAFGDPLSNSCRQIRFTNEMDEPMYISFDGTNNVERVATNSYVLWDFCSNKVNDGGFFLGKETQIYIKNASGAPTSGVFYATVVYGKGDN